jgi:hypothetical protein
MAGKPSRNEVTREGLRFHWLILQMLRKGGSGAEISRITGIKESHISAFKNIHEDVGSGRSGIGAEIVTKMYRGAHLDPLYFFRDYKHKGHPVTDRQGNPWKPSCEVCHRLGILNEDDHELYIFSTERERANQRQLKQLRDDVDRLSNRDQEMAELRAMIVALNEKIEAKDAVQEVPEVRHPKLKQRRRA